MNVSAVLEGRGGAVFVPIVYRLAAELEGITEEELRTDAGSAVYALASARELFGLSILVSHFRLGVEREDGGAEVGVETTRRLVTQLGEATPVFGVISGPRALAGVEGLEQLYSELARSYCEAGAQALLIAEDLDTPPAAPGDDRSLSQLVNVASFFGVPVLLLDPTGVAHDLPGATVLGSPRHPLIPGAALHSSPEEWLDAGATLLLTETEVAPETEPEQLRLWCDAFAAATR